MSCLSPEILEGYLAARLDPTTRHAAEEHLSCCPGCRRRLVLLREASSTVDDISVPDELMSQARIIGRRRAPRAKRLRLGWLATAAALVVAVVGWLRLAPGPATVAPHGTPPEGEVWRAAPGGEIGFQPLAPADGATVVGSVELSWAAVPGVRSYTLMVVDALGDRLLRTTTSETWTVLDLRGLEPPPSPGASLFWSVDAELEDGRRIESATAELRIGNGPRSQREGDHDHDHGKDEEQEEPDP